MSDKYGARGFPRTYRLPIWSDLAIKEIAYDEGRNQNAVVIMLVCEALEARGYTRQGRKTEPVAKKIAASRSAKESTNF